MIKNSFYDTDTTTSDGIELTARLIDISGFTDSMADAYLMGYLPANEMPAAFMPVYLSGGVGEMSAIYHPKNTGWGYGILYHSANDSDKASTITRVNNNIVVQPSEMNVYSFINSAEMARANTGLDISITVTFAFISDAVYDGDGGTTGFVYGGTEAGSWGSGSTQTYNYTFDQFANIIANDLPLFSVTRTGNAGAAAGKSFLFEPRPSDFGDSNDPLSDHKYCVDTGLGLHAVLIIRGYTINAQMQYGNGTGMTGYYLRPFTYPDIDAVGNFGNTKSIIIPSNRSEVGKELTWSYNIPTDTFTLQPGSTSSNSIADYNIFPGGFNFGTLQSAGIDFTAADQNYDLIAKKSIWMGASQFGQTVSGNITAHYTPMDVYRHALLYHKHTTDGTQTSYGDGNTWTTRFNASDAPTGEILTGSYSDIVSNLRPWQLPDVDISTNDFKPEDVPTPEPEDADSSGDDIRDTDFNVSVIGAGNNFITLYAMSSYGLSDMGKKLWASLSDPTYWQTVGTVFTNDFSINPADMLRYFLSLRYFPFNLHNLPHSTASGIYIGRASAPLAPSTGIPYPLRMQKSIAQLDGGSLTIRRKYNDFRDFEPCTAVQIHVPFCGTVDVPASEVVGKTLYLAYKIDLQTGAMLGVISVQSNTYYVIATVAGSCGASIPITANNNIEFLQRIATVAGSGISGGISGGIKGASVGGEVGAVAGAIAGSVGGGVGALAGLPPVTVHKQGNASGFANLGGVPCAYATIQRQRYNVPENYGHTSGYACDVSETIGNLSGFAVCENVDTSGLSCNATERAEIKRLLESGIYV